MPPAMRSENSAAMNSTRIAATTKKRLKNTASASSTNMPLNAVPVRLQTPLPLKLTTRSPASAAAAA